MSIRKFQIEETENLISLLAELSSCSKEQPGHISRETLRSLDNPGEYLVRGEWETVEYWDKWHRFSHRRKNLFRSL
jgi:heme-degrading monooxygenase HmoA